MQWSEKRVAYFRSPWNSLDFVVVVVSLVGAVLAAGGWSDTFRLLRVLRPLRLVSRLKAIQVSTVRLSCAACRLPPGCHNANAALSAACC